MLNMSLLFCVMMIPAVCALVSSLVVSMIETKSGAHTAPANTAINIEL